MRTIFLMSLAAAMIFASCSREDGIENSDRTKETSLSIKLAGVVATKAVEMPGVSTQGTIQLTDGYIFVLDNGNNVIHKEALNVTEARMTTGQRLIKKVAADSKVYIVGNIAEDFNSDEMNTWDDIQAAESEMTTQTIYTEAALANSNGMPQVITAQEDGTYQALVSIKPLISRIELAKVSGEDNILAFTVSGVYVDSYQTHFAYNGTGKGTTYAQGTNTDFSNLLPFYKDEAGWTATGTPLLSVIPAENRVWAYNVASGGLPRLIIKLDDVKYNSGEGTSTVDVSAYTYYLTVNGYRENGAELTSFERGKIYRIGGEQGIVFNEENMSSTPNSSDVSLNVEVVVQEWVIVAPEVIL